MTLQCDFSKATPLAEIYQKELLEEYSYQIDDPLFKDIRACGFNITKVKKVNNPQIYGMYLLHKEELYTKNTNMKEIMLYHATSSENAISIAVNNFDWRKTYRSRFGKGVCFTEYPSYANLYASHREVFIISTVLTALVETINSTAYDLEVPTNARYDTTSGNAMKVLVKYEDYSFYPKYIVYYKKKT